MLGLAAIGVSGCGHLHMWGPTVQGNGETKTESREAQKFSQVTLAGSCEVRIVKSATPSIKVTADSNLLPYIETEIHGGELVVRTKGNLNSKKEMVVEVGVDQLDEVRLSGSGSIDAKGLDESSLKAVLTGSGNIVLHGKASEADFDIRGSGEIIGTDFKAKDAEARISGSGAIRVGPSERLKARVTGSGSISYVGSPQLDKSVTGSGSVEPSN